MTRPLLRCGHHAETYEPTTIYPGRRKRWWCKICCKFVAKK